MTEQKIRSVSGIVNSVETLEGAGFLVHRPFPTSALSEFDPFLLLDEMGPTAELRRFGLLGILAIPVQGLAGAEQATIVGLVFGTIFAVTGRIWMLMCAHASFDLTALAIIYWNLETDVAHLVFK
jgi:hypothetical protein